MRRTLLINLFIGISFLYGLTLRAQGVRVGFTRIDYIIAQMPDSKAVENQLSIQQTQAENELKRLQKEYDDKYAAYQKSGPQLTETIRKDREAELRNLQTRMQEFARAAQTSLQEKYNQLMSPILGKVQQAIDTVAKQNGYQFILNAGTANSSILYTSEELNVTDLVLKQLGVVPGQPNQKSDKVPSTPKSTVPLKKK